MAAKDTYLRELQDRLESMPLPIVQPPARTSLESNLRAALLDHDDPDNTKPFNLGFICRCGERVRAALDWRPSFYTEEDWDNMNIDERFEAQAHAPGHEKLTAVGQAWTEHRVAALVATARGTT